MPKKKNTHESKVTIDYQKLLQVFLEQEENSNRSKDARTLLMAVSTCPKQTVIEKGHYQYGDALWSLLNALPPFDTYGSSKGKEKEQSFAGIKHIILGETGYLHRHSRFLENITQWFEAEFSKQSKEENLLKASKESIESNMYEPYQSALINAKEEGEFWKTEHLDRAQKIVEEKGQSLHFFSWETFCKSQEFRSALAEIKQFSSFQEEVGKSAQARTYKWFQDRWEKVSRAETLRNISNHMYTATVLLEELENAIEGQDDNDKQKSKKKSVAPAQRIKTILNVLLPAMEYLVVEENALLILGQYSQILSQTENATSFIDACRVNRKHCKTHLQHAIQRLYDSKEYQTALKCIKRRIPEEQDISRLIPILKETVTVLESLLSILKYPSLWSNQNYFEEETAAVGAKVFQNNTLSWFESICDQAGSGARIMTYKEKMNPLCQYLSAQQTEEEYRGKISIMPFVPHSIPKSLVKPQSKQKKHLNLISESSKTTAIPGVTEQKVLLTPELKSLGSSPTSLEIIDTMNIANHILSTQGLVEPQSDIMLAEMFVDEQLKQVIQKQQPQDQLHVFLTILEATFKQCKQEDTRKIILQAIFNVNERFKQINSTEQREMHFALSSTTQKTEENYHFTKATPRTSAIDTSFFKQNLSPASSSNASSPSSSGRCGDQDVSRLADFKTQQLNRVKTA